MEAMVAALPDAVHDDPLPDATREELMSAFREWKANP
jgi:hypothetical protein